MLLRTEVMVFDFPREIAHCSTPYFEWPLPRELIQPHLQKFPFPYSQECFGTVNSIDLYFCFAASSRGKFPCSLLLRIFLHICLSVWCSVFLPTLCPFCTGTSLAVHNLHDFASWCVWCENICGSQEHIFLRPRPWARHQHEAVSLAFSPSLSLSSMTSPSIAAQHQLCLSLEWCQSELKMCQLS